MIISIAPYLKIGLPSKPKWAEGIEEMSCADGIRKALIFMKIGQLDDAEWILMNMLSFFEEEVI